MARAPETRLNFADGEYLFRLNLKQIEELQDKCGAGPPEIMRRLSTQSWRLADVRETIRLALIGGGCAPGAALTLVQRYVDDMALAPNVFIALAALQARLYPFEDEPLGKAEAAETSAATDASTSPPSTDSAPPSASAQLRSAT